MYMYMRIFLAAELDLQEFTSFSTVENRVHLLPLVKEISKGERMGITGETCLLICNPLVPLEETTAKHWTFSTSL